MKILLPILLITTLISCSKENFSVVSHTWTLQYFRDTVAVANAAFGCDGDTYWFKDTTVYYNNGEPPVSVTSNDEIYAGKAVFPKWLQRTLTDGTIEREYYIWYERKN